LIWDKTEMDKER